MLQVGDELQTFGDSGTFGDGEQLIGVRFPSPFGSLFNQTFPVHDVGHLILGSIRTTEATAEAFE